MKDSEYERVSAIVSRVQFPGYDFVFGTVQDGDTRYFTVRVFYREPDVMSGVVEDQYGRKWIFPEGQTPGQIVQTCFKAILTSLEHRAREHFTWNGKPVLQPHLDIEALWRSMPEAPRVAEPIFK